MRTKDHLKYLDVELVQDDEMFRYNSDTTILGQFLEGPSIKGKSVLDIGTNNGSLLLYAHLLGAEKLIGCDVFPRALELAKINLEKHTTNFELYESRVQDLDIEPADVVICNPPYFEMNNVTENEYFKKAMFEESLPLEDLFSCFRKLMKDNGVVYTLYPADRFFEFYEMAKKHKMKIMKLRFVHDPKALYALRFVAKLKIGPMTKVKIENPVMIVDGDIKM
ncbi:MAG: methyltransferase domain-containing protein [Erysipelotrichaceae bacterium]|nr:methyltransferase domain-containing protein [Erysipelotrichaceae bacterium]